MRYRKVITATMVAVACLGGPAIAGEWHARFAVGRTDTALAHRAVDDDGEVVRLRGGDSFAAGICVERQISGLLGVEVAIEGARPELTLRVTPAGGDPISATSHMELWTARAGLNLHILKAGPLDLYLGPAVAWLYTPGSSTFRADVGGHSGKVEVEADNGFGWGGTAGVDLDLGRSWTMGLSYTRLAATLDFWDRQHPERRSLDLDPSTLRVGLGLRF